jgi:hypothetical protein
MNRSIARRLALMFAFVALLVFTLVGTGLFLVLRTQLEHHLRESLDDRTEIARIIVYHAVTPEKWRMAREKLTDMTRRQHRVCGIEYRSVFPLWQGHRGAGGVELAGRLREDFAGRRWRGHADRQCDGTG